jgi:hypothetical protein
LKLNKIKVNELSAYRLLFICASILSLVVGIFAIENSATMMKLNDSLSVGEYQDKAEITKTLNDTECLYGTTDSKKYKFSEQKDQLTCLQYSRDLNAHYISLAGDTNTPNMELSYSFSDIQGIMEFCSSEEGKKGGVKEIAIGNLGATFVSCKTDNAKGNYLTLTPVS